MSTPLQFGDSRAPLPLSEPTMEAMRVAAELAKARSGGRPPAQAEEEKKEESDEKQEEEGDEKQDERKQVGAGLFPQDPYAAAQQKMQIEQKKLREAVERRSPPISLDYLVSDGRLRQTVIIRPGILEVTFQTVEEGEETTVIDIAQNLSGDDRGPVFMRRINAMTLALGIVGYKIGGQTVSLPKAYKENKIEPELLFARRDGVKMPAEAYNLTSINFIWFRERARKVFTGDDLGNG